MGEIIRDINIMLAEKGEEYDTYFECDEVDVADTWRRRFVPVEVEKQLMTSDFNTTEMKRICRSSAVGKELTEAILNEQLNKTTKLLRDPRTSNLDIFPYLVLAIGERCESSVATILSTREVQLHNAVADEYSILTMACRYSTPAIVRTLINNGADVNMAGYSHYDIPLLAAVKSGSIDMVNDLLKAGAKVECEDEDIDEDDTITNNPLLMAVYKSYRYNHYQIALTLLKHGANPFKTDPVYGNVILTAFRRNLRIPVEIAMECLDMYPTIITSQSRNRENILHLMLKPIHLFGQCYETSIPSNCVPLDEINDLLVYINKTNSREILVNSKDMYGNTPLYYSLRSRCLDVTTLLLSLGADAKHLTEDYQELLEIFKRYLNRDLIPMMDLLYMCGNQRLSKLLYFDLTPKLNIARAELKDKLFTTVPLSALCRNVIVKNKERINTNNLSEKISHFLQFKIVRLNNKEVINFRFPPDEQEKFKYYIQC